MSHLRKYVLVIAVGIAAAAVVAGCGGDGDQASGEDQEATGPPITKAQFVKKANAICEGLTDRLLAELSPAEEREAEQESEVAAIRARLVPAMEGQIDELRALGTPEGDEEELNAIYETLEGVMQSAKANPQRFLSELGNFKRPYGEVEKLATAYGIQVCSQP